MGFSSVLKKAFPFISIAASMGGPLGTMAANAVGKAIGADKVPATEDGIANAISSAMMDQDHRVALQQAEQDFQLQMATLNVKSTDDLEQIAANDRASARGREQQVKDWMPKALGCVLVGSFVGAVFLLLTGHGKIESALGGTLIGYLAAKADLVATYYFGSSAGSDRKTELLAEAPAIAK